MFEQGIYLASITSSRASIVFGMGGVGVVYEPGFEPDVSDVEGWRLSWDYNMRFTKPLKFRMPDNKTITVRQDTASGSDDVRDSECVRVCGFYF